MKLSCIDNAILLFLVCLILGCSTVKVPNVNHNELSANCSSPAEEARLPDSEKSKDSEKIRDSLSPSTRQHAEKPEKKTKAVLEDPKNHTENEQSESDSDQDLIDAALDYCKASQDFWAEGYLNKAIEALDQAYELILKVDSDNAPKLFQQKEDLRFMISKRILEIHASRYTAVNGNHTAIPLVMNKYVEDEIKCFQRRERKFFIESYKRSGKYRPKIVESLKEAGLPEDLSWLPLIESGFKVRALSRARALGLWQFIPSTGYKFGLNRDAWIDERLDPEKATASAILYLEELHQIFGDWTTVLAAYNCGEGTVLRVIRKQKVNYLDNFWDLYQRLPRETARYVPRFLATLHIIKDPEKYGIALGEPDKPVPYEVVTIDKQLHLKAVAKKLNISYKGIKELNPELRYSITPDNQYAINVPEGKSEVLLAEVANIQKWAPPRKQYVYHRVRKGETLSTIARRYHTSIRSIVMANNIKRKHFIRARQRLKIPVSGKSVSKINTVSPDCLHDRKYIVKKGDSLWLIARKFNTTTKKIKKLNNLSSTRLHVGQTLRILTGKSQPKSEKKKG